MSMFSNLSSAEELEPEVDVATTSRIFDSGAYPMTITMAYGDQSSGGAMNVNFTFKNEDGRELKQTIYVSSGKAKGCKSYYEKDGKQVPLPGFSLVNTICLMTTGKELKDQITEEKTINVWNSELKKEAPTNKDVLMDLLGKEVILGVHKVLENKVTKNDAGAYVPIADTRTVNEITKVFHAETKQTMAEAQAGKSEGAFYDKWVASNTGIVKDKRKIKEDAPEPATTATPKKSLFG